jgi:hypothetical protein
MFAPGHAAAPPANAGTRPMTTVGIASNVAIRWSPQGARQHHQHNPARRRRPPLERIERCRSIGCTSGASCGGRAAARL